jgi:glucose/arabinose dehydrogenase
MHLRTLAHLRTLFFLPIVFLAPVGRSNAAGLPTGFQSTTIATGLSEPAGLAFAPDGRLFVAEKTGKLRLIKNGALLPTPFVDAADLVQAPQSFDVYSERGLLGVAVDPGFPATPDVYIYYSVCKVAGPDTCQVAKNRVARVSAGYEGNPDRGDPASQVVLLDDIDSDTGIHNAGWLGFGPVDGKLYVSVGDSGTGGAKSQDTASLNGKVLRLERDGSIPFNNPFVGLFGARPEVFALGLRNPWRCRFHPDGRLFCGDVGQGDWEEIDWVVAGGNYGWPTTEGDFSAAQYPDFIRPIYAYDHSRGSSITAGAFGSETNFPGDYQQSFFFGDYSWQWIRRLVLAADGLTVTSVSDFQNPSGYVTDLISGPDGALYATDVVTGTVQRISSIGSNRPPVARATATPSQGAAPLTVQFSGDDSSDPDGDPITMLWDFGDGSPTSTDTAPQHTYAAQGGYTATLTVSDDRITNPGSDSMSVPIVVGTPPVVTISEPTSDLLFQGGQTIDLVGSATDAEDGPLPPTALHWEIRFHHATHYHPFLNDLPGSPQSFVTASSGHTETDVSYWIILRATDSSGLTGETELFLQPTLVNLHLETDPPGLQITLDGQPVTTPLDTPGIVGVTRTLGAPSPQGANVFDRWSDGGVQVHTISPLAGGGTYTASFTESGATTTTGPPTTTTTTAPGVTTSSTSTSTSTSSTETSTTGITETTATTSTTTTIPPRCDPARTPEAVSCRLATLRDDLAADAARLGRLAGGLRSRLDYAASRVERAGALCDSGRLSRARAVLRAALRRLSTSLDKVRTRVARQAIDADLGASLQSDLGAMISDVKALRDGLSCPGEGRRRTQRRARAGESAESRITTSE